MDLKLPFCTARLNPRKPLGSPKPRRLVGKGLQNPTNPTNPEKPYTQILNNVLFYPALLPAGGGPRAAALGHRNNPLDVRTEL